MFKTMAFIATFIISAGAYAAKGDCNLSNSCPGNPNQSVATESAFNDTNMRNITEVFTQVASSLGNTGDGSEMSGFTPLGPSLSEKSKPGVMMDDVDDTIEK